MAGFAAQTIHEWTGKALAYIVAKASLPNGSETDRTCLADELSINLLSEETLVTSILSYEEKKDLEEFLYLVLDAYVQDTTECVSPIIKELIDNFIDNVFNDIKEGKLPENNFVCVGSKRFNEEKKENENIYYESKKENEVLLKSKIDVNKSKKAVKKTTEKGPTLVGTGSLRKIDIRTKEGRITCLCQGTDHALVNNCLYCGRIVCEQEGSGPCLHCGAMVLSRNEVSTPDKDINSLEENEQHNEFNDDKKNEKCLTELTGLRFTTAPPRRNRKEFTNTSSKQKWKQSKETLLEMGAVIEPKTDRQRNKPDAQITLVSDSTNHLSAIKHRDRLIKQDKLGAGGGGGAGCAVIEDDRDWVAEANNPYLSCDERAFAYRKHLAKERRAKDSKKGISISLLTGQIEIDNSLNKRLEEEDYSKLCEFQNDYRRKANAEHTQKYTYVGSSAESSSSASEADISQHNAAWKLDKLGAVILSRAVNKSEKKLKKFTNTYKDKLGVTNNVNAYQCVSSNLEERNWDDYNRTFGLDSDESSDTSSH